MEKLNKEIEDHLLRIFDEARQAIYVRIDEESILHFNLQKIALDICAIFNKVFKELHWRSQSWVRKGYTRGFGRANSNALAIMTPSNLKPDFDGAFKELGQKLSSFDDFFRKEIPTSFESFDPSINKDKFLKEYSKKNSVIENISDTIAQLIIEKAHEMGKIAYHDRMKEIEVNQTTPIFSVSEEVREKAKEDAAGLIREGKEPLTIKIWRHSHLASVHPHHKKMHGKAVPIDMNFIYENKKGEKFQTPNPHDKSLPESEKTECRCSTVTKVLFKTPSEIAEIRTRAATTGGYTDPEWAIK